MKIRNAFRFVFHVSFLLWLDDKDFRTPLLERMPELVGAKVRINSSLDDCHCEDPSMACYHVMRAGDTSAIEFDSDDEEGSEDYAGQNTTKCVVLEGLAQAKDLVLIADHSTVHPDMSFTPVHICVPFKKFPC